MGMDHAYKHYCKICKKGFGCGQALGGHMRAHGINDDRVTTDDFDEDPSASGEWEEKPSPNKRMYGLRANPNRHKCFRVCDNCGEEFFSWKSFLDHGKCSLDNEADDDEIVSSQRWDGGGWSKGKRKAPFVASSEEEDLANCLVMLSSARVDTNPMTVVETESSSASAGKEDDRRLVIDRIPNERWKNPVACGVPRGMFECKACKKVFSSHQALGGHRASHKKVKGCFASRIDALDYPPSMDEVAVEMTMAIVPYDRPPPPKKASKVHECSICHRVFSSGQALGGHKRCHWLTSNSPDGGSVARFNPITDDLVDHQLTLNLNLPAMANYVAAVRPVPWTDQSEDKRNDKGKAAIDVVDDEAESRVKLAKLSDLKDMKVGGEGSWLQVGIGSSSNEGGGL